MLVRSAGRRQQRHTSQQLAASFAQLHLPWLAPALLQWSALHSPTTSSPATHHTRRTIRHHTTRVPSSAPAQSAPQSRGLATAVDPQRAPSSGHGHLSSSHTYGPGFRNTAPVGVQEHEGAARPNLYGDLRPIIINNSMRPSPLANIKLGGSSVTARESLVHLNTCLAVGRRDRAALIVQRMADTISPAARELAMAHTAYLEDGLKRLMAYGRDSSQSQIVLKDMQRWFEVEIRDKGVQLEAKMIVIMMRAVIRALDGPRRDRSIRRYTELAGRISDEILGEVLESDDYDDIEIPILERATPEHWEDADGAEANDGTATPAHAERATDAETSQMPAGRTEGGIVDLQNTPEVLATEQKGAGLDSVKEIMNSFSKMVPASAAASPEEQSQNARTRQQVLERTSVKVAIDQWKAAEEELRSMGRSSVLQSKPIAAMMWEWQQALVAALEQELAEIKRVMAPSTSNKETDRHRYGPHLELLPLETTAGITILVAITAMAQGKRADSKKFESDVKLAQLLTTLGDALESESKMAKAAPGKSGNAGSNRNRKRAVRTRDGKEDAGATPAKRKSKPTKKQMQAESLDWSQVLKLKYCSMLLSKLIETAQVPVSRQVPRTGEWVQQTQAAFSHKMRMQLGKKIGVIAPNPELVKKLANDSIPNMVTKRMPMVYPPREWRGYMDGGYLETKTPILRLMSGDKDGQIHFKSADREGYLGQVYDGLNALSGVPWRIHPGVFKVQLEAWNSGKEIANFAPLNPDLPYPPEPDADADSEDSHARYKWMAEVRDIKNKLTGLHSKRCFQNFQLEIARTVINETLYFPHNLDFRGRAYPIPPYLNHMGADNVRGLLVFADGKELGEAGLRWLHIHLASVAGNDKASQDERVEWTKAHMDDIRDSVRDPLGGRRWWLKSEDAWQTLAACFELTQAMELPDPTKFVSHLPIQQDGTCNGLQHYAALGGDEAGAAQVNLVPGDRPADVYTAVADAVREEVEKDAAEGHPVALTLRGRLTRKCVKQPVMTNVYGVTFYGAKEQVRKQLEVLFPEVKPYGEVNLGNMSHYVATKIFKSLGTMFKGAQSIQSWLGQCADRISTCLKPEQIEELMSQQKTAGPRPKKPKKVKVAKPKKAKKLKKGEVAPVEEVKEEVKQQVTPQEETLSVEAVSAKASIDGKSAKPLFRELVVWTTPLRLPVVQPYRTSKAKNVATSMQGVSILDPSPNDPVSKRKQLQAFPPNFIHSLDATHMLLSAARCKEHNLTFASIHDSFWTHACDVDVMNERLRSAFVEMHQGDIIKRLRDEFNLRYKDRMYLASVMANSKVGEAIAARRAELKNDTTIKDSELALEWERMRLLNSADPEEVAKGEAMVTPGSIYLSEPDKAAFAAPLEMEGHALGAIPGTKDQGIDTVNEASTLSSTEDVAPAAGNIEPEDLPEALPETELDDTLEPTETNSDETQAATAAKPSKGPVKKIFVWLPLTFPEVPARGAFQVGDVMKSTYFFH